MAVYARGVFAAGGVIGTGHRQRRRIHDQRSGAPSEPLHLRTARHGPAQLRLVRERYRTGTLRRSGAPPPLASILSCSALTCGRRGVATQGILESAGFAAEVSAHYVAVEGQVRLSFGISVARRGAPSPLLNLTSTHACPRGRAEPTKDHHPHEVLCRGDGEGGAVTGVTG
jgi:hypothetical protein